MEKGIDVSYAQGNINWKRVQTDFAIIRAGYGRESSQKDAQFDNNYEGCKSNKVPCGAYWYSYALSADEAKKEAAACISVIKGKKYEYPIYYDIENSNQFALGKTKCTEIARAFLEELESQGYWAGLYSSKQSLEQYFTEDLRKRYAVWVANYDVDETDYNGPFGIWQYSSEGKMNGISGNVDMNYCYIDYPSFIKRAGKNGFVAEKPTLDKTGYKKGDSTIGSLALKEMLLIAQKLDINKYGMDENSSFGDGTLRAVNGLLKKWGYQENGIAGRNFIMKLKSEIFKKI